jgi:hypothetical protein
VLLRLPDSWPTALVATLAMTVLAILDLAGAVAAKEAVTRRSPSFALVGAILFVLLFWVYASSLQYAELAPVTMGWVVILQVGVVLVDHYRYGTPMTTSRSIAVVVILLAQAFLLLGPGGQSQAPGTAGSHVVAPDASHANFVPGTEEEQPGPIGRQASRCRTCVDIPSLETTS